MLKGNETALVLSAARDLIAYKRHWCKDVLAKTNNETYLSFKPPFLHTDNFQQFCARGALMQVVGAKRFDMAISYSHIQSYDALLTAQVQKLYPGLDRGIWPLDIALLNNTHRHKDVLRCFDAAIKEAQETF